MSRNSYSFPSGHTVGSTVIYGLLAYLAWQYLPQPWNVIGAIFCVLLILLISLSRIYLGAHFPSDVVAGWVLGAIGLAVIIFVVKP
jgi:undecaprenyl-diphosphatase